ncbi:UNVERIFIED_CONTAM: hypothetical protein HDU68_006012 [Siphonaria sp. JEL0065]|nr:hypothetical protein HDU68_006012 [Siphonaria sp. JEL0065]
MKKGEVYEALRLYAMTMEVPQTSSIENLQTRAKLAALPDDALLCLAVDAADEGIRRNRVASFGKGDSKLPVNVNYSDERNDQRSALSSMDPLVFGAFAADVLDELEARISQNIIDKFNTKHGLVNSYNVLTPISSNSSDKSIDESPSSQFEVMNEYIHHATEMERSKEAPSPPLTSEVGIMTVEPPTVQIDDHHDLELQEMFEMMKSMEETNMALQSQIATLEEKNKDWEQRYAELEKMWEVDNMPQEITRLEKLTRDLEVKLADATQKYDTLQEQFKLLETKNQEESTSLSLKTSENAKLFAEIKSWQRKHDSLAQENQKLREMMTSQPPMSPQSPPRRTSTIASNSDRGSVLSASTAANVVTLNGSSRRRSMGTTSSLISQRLQPHPSPISTPTNSNSNWAQQLNLQSDTQFSLPATPQPLQSQTDSSLDPTVQSLISQFYSHTHSLLQVVRQCAHQKLGQPKDTTQILLPLKKILVTCRSISETALPASPEFLDTLDARKQSLSESLVLLMGATKRFALEEESSAVSVSVADVERECAGVCADVDALKAVLILSVNTVEENQQQQQEEQRQQELLQQQQQQQQFAESTKTWIQEKTNSTIQSIQGLLQVLREITVDNVRAGIVPDVIVPKVLEITDGVDELISSSDPSVLATIGVFGCTKEIVEEVVLALDGSKGVLEELGGGLIGYRGGSGVNGWGESDEDGEVEVRALKHKIWTASYDLVRSMKEFCDLFGV